MTIEGGLVALVPLVQITSVGIVATLWLLEEALVHLVQLPSVGIVAALLPYPFR